jgi:hypothetical protein
MKQSPTHRPYSPAAKPFPRVCKMSRVTRPDRTVLLRGAEKHCSVLSTDYQGVPTLRGDTGSEQGRSAGAALKPRHQGKEQPLSAWHLAGTCQAPGQQIQALERFSGL